MRDRSKKLEAVLAEMREDGRGESPIRIRFVTETPIVLHRTINGEKVINQIGPDKREVEIRWIDDSPTVFASAENSSTSGDGKLSR